MQKPHFLDQTHDPNDPNPWLALYMDERTPLPDHVKRAWLSDSASTSRQYLLPVIRPLARFLIILIQLLKIVLPNTWSSSTLLHRILVWGLKHFASPQANWLILRHFHLGSQILQFIATNAGVQIPMSPLEPTKLADLTDHLFVKHDVNLFNFVINLNKALRDQQRCLGPVQNIDFSMILDPPLALDSMPSGRLNRIDVQTAIEIFTPVYQLFLTDNDFWRASNSLQLDETIGVYVATILSSPEHLLLLNNKHPLVPLSTLHAGHRLVLHGLSSEMLHCILSQMKMKAISGSIHPMAKKPQA